MPEPRARVYHRNRVAHSFAEEIGAMLEGELSDPRLYPATVTEVVLAPGGKSARIFISVIGGEEPETSTLAALTAARGFIRAQIRARMGVRHVPDLTFAVDRSRKRDSKRASSTEEPASSTEKRASSTQEPVSPDVSAAEPTTIPRS